LARPAEPHFAQTQPDEIVAGWSIATIFREPGERSRLAGLLVEHLDRPAPSLGLRGIYLAKIEHVTLRHATVVEASIFDDAPVEMRFPVLPPLGLSASASPNVRARANTRQEHGE